MRSILLWSVCLAAMNLSACGGATAGSGADGSSEAVACAAKGYSLLYVTPGCGLSRPDPVCMPDYACASLSCGCEGKVLLGGCDGFKEPFAYRFSSVNTSTLGTAGTPCDPDNPPAAP